MNKQPLLPYKIYGLFNFIVFCISAYTLFLPDATTLLTDYIGPLLIPSVLNTILFFVVGDRRLVHNPPVPVLLISLVLGIIATCLIYFSGILKSLDALDLTTVITAIVFAGVPLVMILHHFTVSRKTVQNDV